MEVLLLAGDLSPHNLLLRGEVLEIGLYLRNFIGEHHPHCPKAMELCLSQTIETS